MQRIVWKPFFFPRKADNLLWRTWHFVCSSFAFVTTCIFCFDFILVFWLNYDISAETSFGSWKSDKQQYIFLGQVCIDFLCDSQCWNLKRIRGVYDIFLEFRFSTRLSVFFYIFVGPSKIGLLFGCKLLKSKYIQISFENIWIFRIYFSKFQHFLTFLFSLLFLLIFVISHIYILVIICSFNGFFICRLI